MPTTKKVNKKISSAVIPPVSESNTHRYLDYDCVDPSTLHFIVEIPCLLVLAFFVGIHFWSRTAKLLAIDGISFSVQKEDHQAAIARERRREEWLKIARSTEPEGAA